MTDQKQEVKEIELEEEDPGVRIISLYGPVDEEMIEKTITSMMALSYMGGDTIQMIISTGGGLATEMFALYDVMRNVREDIEIVTLGLGKVMSAGVLLLAAGTKGKRKIGKHTRVMIHGLKTDLGGYLNDIKNDYDELRAIEKVYIDALSKETNMTKTKLRELFAERRDIFISAEEAVEYGIADEVI
jgi:ATP-dependent Clp protease protease subunit